MKPCPFCGSENVGYSYGAHPDGRELSFISCSDCGARGPARTYLCLADDDESEGAWDTRHNVQAQGRCAALSRSVPWSAVLELAAMVCGSRKPKTLGAE